MSVTYIKLQVNPVCKLKKILFNIECYGEFFSSITPLTYDGTKGMSPCEKGKLMIGKEKWSLLSLMCVL
jgi:hypothetical protein